MLTLNINSDIFMENADAEMPKAVRYAADAFRRDLRNSCLDTEEPGAMIVLRTEALAAECFCIHVEKAAKPVQMAVCENGERSSDGSENGDAARMGEDRKVIVVSAADELGFIYGIYWLSRKLLGVKDLWFWNDQEFHPRKEHEVSENLSYASGKAAVRFRGWFINDEVLLDHWNYENDPELKWQMVFEALLRMGGNATIPGTDQNSRIYDRLASDMGLYISHHHAQPLGAEMFARAYPNVRPSIFEHHALFRKLWQEAVDRQKGMKVIWSLGFRGQGDYSFWDDDPSYDTDEKRGQLLSDVIMEQYAMVKKADPKAVCCTNLYGEVMELYEKGCLKLPEDIIFVWSDNGYGRMVSRRQWNSNPRIYSLPKKGEKGHHGIYYHASFYDLQASAVLTMLPNAPELVASELTQVLMAGASDFWMINASNIKPHVYYLDYIAAIWRGEREMLARPEKHLQQYVWQYYGKAFCNDIEDLYKRFWEAAVKYGEHADDHAGEQFPNCMARVLVSEYMKHPSERSEYFLYCTNAKDFAGQMRWFLETTKEAAKRYQELYQMAEGIMTCLSESSKRLFLDSIFLQIQIMRDSYQGAYEAARSVQLAAAGDYLHAFYIAGKAWEAFDGGDRRMRAIEHGKWIGFYANDCQSDIKNSAWVMENFMGYLRTLGDGPHYYDWMKRFMESEGSRRVSLLMNKENHPDNHALYVAMKKEMDR